MLAPAAQGPSLPFILVTVPEVLKLDLLSTSLLMATSCNLFFSRHLHLSLERLGFLFLSLGLFPSELGGSWVAGLPKRL